VYAEDELIPLSALQHYQFCPRQCALIHVEQTWVENRYTAEGRIQHARVDAGGTESRGDVRTAFGVMLRSLRLGLSGKADVLEFHRKADGGWVPFPVEHKRGRRKEEDWDRIQLCAQSICLEEMLCIPTPEGAIFYGKERRREHVVFSEELRGAVERIAIVVHTLLSSGKTPQSVYDSSKCDNCSLKPVCLPQTSGRVGRVDRYLRKVAEPPCDTT